jgi:hypothetical protein
MWRQVIVRIVLGALLFLTAGLKLYGIGTTGIPQAGWFAQPWVQLLAAEWELFLGAWLWSGIASRASWLLALITFLAFAGLTGYLGWVGVASCGCLGAIKTNPWWALGADLAVVGLLAVSRPAVESGSTPQFLRAAGVWVSSVALLFAILAGASVLIFGSTEVAVAKLRGETVVMVPYVDFGVGRPNDMLETTATVANYTEEPVRLIGGTTDCSCATVDDFPLTVPPDGKASFRVRLRVLSNTSGQLTRTVTVRTDCPSRPVIQFRIGCRVEE